MHTPYITYIHALCERERERSASTACLPLDWTTELAASSRATRSFEWFVSPHLPIRNDRAPEPIARSQSSSNLSCNRPNSARGLLAVASLARVEHIHSQQSRALSSLQSSLHYVRGYGMQRGEGEAPCTAVGVGCSKALWADFQEPRHL